MVTDQAAIAQAIAQAAVEVAKEVVQTMTTARGKSSSGVGPQAKDPS